MSSALFRIVLVLSGAAVIFLALNVALGGIPTMGWLGERPFLSVTDEAQYALIDNHVRFFGGLFAGLGLLLFLAATDPVKYRQATMLVFGAIFVGGLARFSAPDISVVFAPEIVNSLAAELVLMPLLAFWLSRLSR
ncbi:DUF4345 domain-containing protein [Parvibaculum sp.]|uniref:DUF4345 domain-containing protein n=1 Tax=Parvibaculum sp. TaxID=2024848 RepID=UPI001D7C88C4|nr:DUF4345 domain-containing protein [Parvibaculum sp.]MBX3489684.1 DUF4345 family protein [Parvibaculum sp.]MCW5726358.1 DUF4345 family protein [Parvibaculum sp.]